MSRLFLGIPRLGLEELDARVVGDVLVPVLELLFRLGHELVHDPRLLPNEPIHHRLELIELGWNPGSWGRR